MINNLTKDKIINTAYALFREKGYNNVTILDICRACGITKTTFYYHLRSKEEIISNFYESITMSIANQLVDMLSADNYWEQLMICFESLIKSSEQMGADLISQLLIMNLNKDMGTYDFNEQLTKMAVLLIEKAQKAGQIRNQSPAEPLYRAAAYVFTGYETMWCIKEGNFNRIVHVRHALENIFDVDPSLRTDGDE